MDSNIEKDESIKKLERYFSLLNELVERIVPDIIEMDQRIKYLERKLEEK